MERINKYLISYRCADKPEAKTHVWELRSSDGSDLLGLIKWFGRWRRYCFFPEMGSIYEQQCLRAIATFVERKTCEHLEAARNAATA